MKIFDRGSYETEKWRDDEVIVVLNGSRVSGRYVLFRTAGKDWMIHRMDPAPDGWTAMPESVRPMLAAPAIRLPADDDAWGYELWWPGDRAMAYVSGGRLDLQSVEDRDVTPSFPETRGLAEALAPIECVLDGVVVAFDNAGRVSAAALQSRRAVPDSAAARRVASRVPVQYLIFDLIWLDGQSTVDMSYVERRELLAGLELAGPHWQLPPHFVGGGSFARQAARDQGLPGVVAKRLDSPYAPGKRNRQWLGIRVAG
ncbi:MAG TPA: ATP-dependent DNA ligase, partial [Micromonosporaceae bacterium]|nr:ATP-dependent DNA ligase [Micromonosporaceae bacterium]